MSAVSQLLNPDAPASLERPALRKHLIELRRGWLAQPEAQAAQARLLRQVTELLRELEPQCLGLYSPLDGEFDAQLALQAFAAGEALALALPFAFREGRRMDYRRWDGRAPAAKDECGIPSCNGAVVVPDVVLVPCVGFTREGYRLGYGGGYFDCWLAAHPGVTSVGLAWNCCEADFAIEPHDQALTLLLTETDVIAP